MSTISLILLVVAAVATAVSGAALRTAYGLRHRLDTLQAQTASALDPVAVADAPDGVTEPATVPAARRPPAEEIRSAVVEVLAEERERELAEARAFWAAQEARGTGSDAPLLEGRGTEYEISAIDAALLDALLEGELDQPRDRHVFVPRQPGPEDIDAQDEDRPAAPGTESAELAAARRRHPSHPDYTLRGEPVTPAPPPEESGPPVADDERTVQRLAELADARTPLADVRPGPLGTLDVYVFVDGTTICMSPGHRETAGRLAQALADGKSPALLGGSGVSGAYTLTFTCGEDNLYVLADRVIASL